MLNKIKPLLSLKTKKGYSVFSILVVALFSVWVISDALKKEIVIAADGETTVVKTSHETVGEVLEELGIKVNKHDHISHSVQTQIEEGMEIFFKKANKITLTINDEEETYYTTAETVGHFFEEEDLSFSKHDELSHEETVLIESDLNIIINTAFEVVIDDGGKEKKIWTTGGTVEEILEEHDVTYGDLDRITPSLDKSVTQKENEIEVVNVQFKTETIEEEIAFDTEEKKDHSLEKGKTKTISEGKSGIVEKTYEVVYENGEEVERKVIDETVKEESENRVVAVGTKEPKKQTTTASSNNKSSTKAPSGGKEFVMQATAYTANCNGCSGYTATGINLNANPNAKVIAVDPNVIPLGSKVWVEGYGTAIAGDTGGSIRGNRIDAHMPTQSDAQKFGRRTVRVKVLD